MISKFLKRLGLRSEIDKGQFDNRVYREGLRTRQSINNYAYKAEISSYRDRGILLFPIGKSIEWQNRTIAKKLLQYLSKVRNLEIDINEGMDIVTEFRNSFLQTPFGENSGGANFNTALILFATARILNPQIIVESGVFRGVSTYFLRLACPNAEIISYDVNLNNLTIKIDNVNYYESDWFSETSVYANNRVNLIYFDDHQDQGVRLLQAYERGFKNILFDDTWPIDVPGGGWLPVPTINMILDDRIQIGETYDWVENDIWWSYLHTRENDEVFRAIRQLVVSDIDWPVLYRQTGIIPTSIGKFLRIR